MSDVANIQSECCNPGPCMQRKGCCGEHQDVEDFRCG